MDETQKRCSKCREMKHISEFNWADKARGYRDPKCRDCRKAAHRRWYLANRDYKLMRNMKWYRENRDAHIRKVLSRRGSSDDDAPSRARRPRDSDAGQ